MSAVVQFQPSRLPANKPITLAMRIALRMAAAWPLVRCSDRLWRCRKWPDEKILDATVRGLAERGMLLIESRPALYLEMRESAVTTPRGQAALDGRTLTSDTPPPVGPEVVLRHVEEALAGFSRQIDALRQDILRDSEAARDARQRIAAVEASIVGTERRLIDKEAARERLEACRVDLRALVAHACERMGEEMAGAR